jgi:formate hydrogenlyase subunit 6/NADH:ubiquinone oxidoreductase subunit I
MILAWIHDVVEAVQSCVTGMRTTGRFLVENLKGEGGGAAVTRQYPEQPAEVVGDRQRGHLVNDAKRCIVCHACDTACPVDCFKMDGERDADNKMRASRFDIDLSKCIYCGLCVRACPTDSLSMTATFEMAPQHEGKQFLFRRNSKQVDVRLDLHDVDRMNRLAALPRAELSDADRTWLDERIDPRGQHLIGMYGLGYYTPELKAEADAQREAKKKAKDAAAAAAAAAAKAKAAAAAAAGVAPAAGPAAGSAAAARPATPAPAAAPPPATPPAPKATPDATAGGGPTP